MRPSSVALLLDAVKTAQGGLGACDTDPTQHPHTLRLQRVIRASAPYLITFCQLSVMNDMLARVSLRRGSL